MLMFPAGSVSNHSSGSPSIITPQPEQQTFQEPTSPPVIPPTALENPSPIHHLTNSGDSRTSSSTSNSLVPPLPARTHRMTTRRQSNIYKLKKLFAATKHPLPMDVEPSTLSQALASPYWRDAMADELTALQHHGTWDLVPPPPNANIIGCKWVFRIK